MDPLPALLAEQAARHAQHEAVHTQREIVQQPDTWPKMFSLLTDRRGSLPFLKSGGPDERQGTEVNCAL
jgi:hypothetical protein